MQHTVTTSQTDPQSFTVSLYSHGRYTPGWITHNTIVMPRCGTPAPLTADTITTGEIAKLARLFTATADRLASLVNDLARLERDAESGAVSPATAARRLRRILAAIEATRATGA
jgi:hypothetical protein